MKSKMRYFWGLGFIFGYFTQAFSQDILVTNSGESLKVYNLEIGSSTVFYQLSEDANADTKRIAKSDVLIIRKADGTKLDPNANGVSGTNNVDNLTIVREYNQRELKYKGTNTNKRSEALVGVLGLKEGSIIETDELKATFAIKKYVAFHGLTGKLKTEGLYDLTYYDVGQDTKMNKLIITLRNKTDNTIYIDLGNSFLAENNESQSLYVPTATSTITGTSSGTSVNMGAVAGALGVGGAVGTLAGGVNVSGGSSSATSQTTYSQRVIAIPPMSSKSLEPLYIGEGSGFVNQKWFFDYHILRPYASFFIQNGYAIPKKKSYHLKDINCGTIIDIPVMDDISALSVYVTYSTNESFAQTKALRINFYLRQIMGIEDINDVDFSQIPTVFLQQKINRISEGIFD